MLPVDSAYGPWPLSGEYMEHGVVIITPADIFLPTGEIDIMEARGNGPSYPAQYVSYRS